MAPTPSCSALELGPGPVDSHHLCNLRALKRRRWGLWLITSSTQSARFFVSGTLGRFTFSSRRARLFVSGTWGVLCSAILLRGSFAQQLFAKSPITRPSTTPSLVLPPPPPLTPWASPWRGEGGTSPPRPARAQTEGPQVDSISQARAPPAPTAGRSRPPPPLKAPCSAPACGSRTPGDGAEAGERRWVRREGMDERRPQH
jgi:hypothetical protein